MTSFSGVVFAGLISEIGWMMWKPYSEIKPAKTTPLKDVKEAIRQQLLQQKKNDAMTKWVEDLNKDFKDEIVYQTGFKPPAAQTTTGETDSEE